MRFPLRMTPASGLLSLLLLAAACEPTETTNGPPVAIAGTDQTVFFGETTSLDGSNSFDPDADDLTYSWTVTSAPEGSALVAGDSVADTATTDFTPDAVGAFVLSLRVTDTLEASSLDAVVIEARNVLTVVGNVPAEGATGVANRTPVVVFFSEPIRPWTADAALVVEDITDAMNPVPVLGTVSVDDGNTAVVFTPASNWGDLTPYQVTVTTAAKGLDGAPLRTPVIFEFEGAAVDLVPPTVLAVDPPDASIDQPVHSTVQLLFSEPVDPATVPAAFALTGAALEDGAVVLSAGNTKATFIPADTAPDPDVPHVLALSTDYTVDLAATVTDAAANPMASAFSSTFRTEDTDNSGPPVILSVSPLTGAGGVSVKLPVVATFSEPVDPATVTTTTFQLLGGTTAAPAGSISMALGNTVAILQPDVNLETSTRYDVLVTDGVSDLSGNMLDGDADGAAGGSFGSFFTTGLAPPPSVYSATPLTAPQIDSTVTVDITGEDFVDGATVLVLGGGVLVNSTTFVSDTALQAEITISPAASLGSRTIVVTNPDGQTGEGFNLIDILDRAPIVTSISTASVSGTSVAQGQTMAAMSVFGSYFKNGATVSISGADVTPNNVTFINGGVSSELQLDLDVGVAAAIGFRDVTVTNPDTQTDTLLGALEVTAPPPVVTSLDITSGRRKETLNVTINGTDFQAGASVSFGAGVGVTAVDDTGAPTQLVATIAIAGNAVAGSRNVTVTNPDNANDTLMAAFDVLRAVPSVTGANPAMGSRGDTLNVDILGADFDCSGAMTPLVDFNDANIAVNMVSCTGMTEFETTVTANVTINSPNAATGLHNVSVTNMGDVVVGTGVGVFNVRLEPPTLTSAAPNVEQGQANVDVTLTGDFFQATPSVGTPAAGVTINSVTYVDPMTLTVNLSVDYSVPIGTYDLTVTNPDGQLVTMNVLNVVTAPPPTVTAAIPNRGAIGDTNLDVTIIGTGFQPGAGTTTVAFSGMGITVNSVNVTSDTSLVANIDITANTGLRDITVTNPVGTVPDGTGLNLFRVTDTPPVITDINPNSGDVDTMLTNVQINGSDFRAGATVDFGADIGVTINSIATNQILVDLDLTGSIIGFHNVTVTNTDTTSDTLTNGFEVVDPAGTPAIATIRVVRDSGGNLLHHLAGTLMAGKTSTVHIIGSNFDPAASVLISGGGLTLGAPTVDASGTRIDIDVTVSCGDIVPGGRDVTVINPNGSNGTKVDGVDVRNGVVMNEVVTDDQSNHGCGGTSNREMLELHNSSDCTYDMTNWHLDMIDNNASAYVMGDGLELYSGGASRTSFPSGAFVMICRPDNGGDNMQNDIFLALYTNTGRFIDDIEIGDDRENDGTDGGPAIGNDGASNNTSNESVGRCPDGRDTNNDVDDLFQDETGGVDMASTERSSNNAECPVCSDGLDNDGDGWRDADDPGCSSPLDNNENGFSGTACNNNMDDDGNGDADAADPDCFDGSDNDENI